MGKIIKDSNGKALKDSNGKVFEATAAIDSNILPENIKKGVTIMGVTGTYEGTPYDTEIEYIEGTGTQYIRTGLVLATSNYRWKIKVTVTALAGTASSGYYGVMGLNGAPQIGWYNGGWTPGNAGSSTPYAPVIGTEYLIEYSKNFDGSYWVDGYDTNLKRTGNMTCNLLWCSGAATYGRCKLHYAQCYNRSNELVFDLIPVRIGTQGYLYDKVSGELFGNAGTGSFILGPDVISDSEALNIITQGT